MDRKHENLHYHIRWSDKATLDWQRFLTYAEAEVSAKELLMQNESYTIEEHDEVCPRCQDAMELKTAHGIPKEASA